MSDSLLKLNVMTVVPIFSINKNSTSYDYILESNLWHDRLGNVNFDTSHRLIGFDYIPKFEIDPNHKCEICVEAKLTKFPFKSVKGKTEPLE